MVVVGASQVEQFWLKEMKREFGRFADRLQFTWTNELSFAEIVAVPDDAGPLRHFLRHPGAGRQGGTADRKDTVTSLHDAANVPLFALYGMGRGIVGGPLLSTDELSRTTARVALRVLAGESPGGIKTPTQRAASRPTTRASCDAGTSRSDGSR